MDKAAENGHIDVVQLPDKHRKEGCSTDAMDGAARNGHTIKWLDKHRKEGCTEAANMNASDNGHSLVADW
eukprot:38868-Eustigmatos_ZCMA.PRE.1